MNTVVSFEKHHDIGVISVDNPPVNALSQAVRAGLLNAVNALERDAAINAIVLYCQGRTFIAGADISEFDKPMLVPQLPEVLKALESVSKPVIAAIHGTAFGGGLETTLACHYRCAVATARVGLPEVKLGIIPGAGGTQRLPRIIGVEKALAIISSGDPISATEAKQYGVIDEIIDGDLLTSAINYAKQLVATNAPLRKLRDITIDPPAAGFFDEFRRSIARKTRGFYAPERCIQAIEAAVELPFDEGLQRERELFFECKETIHSQAQRHLFFAERAVNKIPDIDKNTPRREIAKVAVLGAGTMGGGIAMNFANAGIPVTIVEMAAEPLERGLGIIRKNYEATARKGRLSAEQVEQRMSLLSGSTDYAALADADLIIEAVFENMAIKKEVFTKIDSIAKPGAILASNTSTLDLDEIAAVTQRPQDVIGLHFFSPANVMRLLEIVRGAKTDKTVVATCMDMAKTIRKVGVLSGVCYGFIGNRMLEGYLREAGAMLLEGALPEQIDQVIYDFGMAMGPFAMSDLAGIDVGYKVRQENKHRLTHLANFNYAVISDHLAEMGRFGQKTGRGFYIYEAGSRTPTPDPEVKALIESQSAELGIERRTISDDEILARCLYPLINEGALILQEGIALRASDIDVVWASGYGFPLYRGGPMFYADSVGLDQVLSTIRDYQQRFGQHWQPAPLLEQLVEQGRSFGDFDKNR